jgi:MFS-type transporter involved in bile tolerance (Atg22 family)
MTNKIASILLYILAGVSVVFVLLFYFGPYVQGTENTPMEEPIVTESILFWTYALAGLAAGLTIIFQIVNIIKNPANAKKTLTSILLLGVVVFLAYVLASDQVMNITGYTGEDNVPGTLKTVGAGLITLYLLIGVAVVSALFSEIARYFK